MVEKVDSIDTTKFLLKTTFDKYNLDKEKAIESIADVIEKHGSEASKNELDAGKNKIPDTNSLVKKTDLNSKITETENKIPSINGLAFNSALTAVENKIPKRSKIEKKVSDNDHDKYIATSEFNVLATRSFNARLAQVDLVTKKDFDVRLQSLNKKITSNKTKHLHVETELKKLEKFDVAYFRGKNYFDNDGTQNCLVFQPV